MASGLEPTSSVGAAPPSMRGQALRGAGWLLGQSVGTRLIGVGSQIVLARLLAPSDFGSVGLAGTVFGIVGMLADFGLQDVVLQRRRALPSWTTPAFWASLGLSGLGLLIVGLVAPLAALVYRTPQIVPLLLIMGISLPIAALAVVPTVVMRSRFEFRQLALYSTLEVLVTQVSMAVLAWLHCGPYSFVIPLPLVALMKAIVLWRLVRPRIGRVRFRLVRAVVARGVHLFSAKMVTAAVSQGDYIALGFVASTAVVGPYYFGFKLAVQPLQLLAGSVAGVVFPVLAQMGRDGSRQREAALNASRVLAYVAFPACFLQAALAAPVVHLLVGHKWDASIPIIQLLSIGLGFDAISWVAGSLLRARGEFRRTFLYACMNAVMFFAAVTLGARLGTNKGVSVALAVGIYYATVTPLYSFLTFRLVGAKATRVLALYTVPPLLSVVSIGLASYVGTRVTAGDIPRCLVTAVVGLALYLGLLRLVAPDLVRAGQAQLAVRLTARFRRAM